VIRIALHQIVTRNSYISHQCWYKYRSRRCDIKYVVGQVVFKSNNSLLYITSTDIVHYLHSYCTLPPLILYITSTDIVHYLHWYCTLPLLILYITSTHIEHYLHSYCTLPPLILNITSTHIVHYLHSYSFISAHHGFIRLGLSFHLVYSVRPDERSFTIKSAEEVKLSHTFWSK